MILGICGATDEDRIKLAKGAGYRYIEAWLPRFCGSDENRANYEDFRRALDKHKIRCEVGQFAFPGEYNQDGAQTDAQIERIRDYVSSMLEATSDLCVERLVIGAGGARVLPSPDKYENAMEQMADILRRAVSPALDEFGVIAALEPLVKKETAMLNTTAQGVRLAKMAGCTNIKVMVDLYHSANEDKDFGEFPGYKGYIMHSHIGRPSPRRHPAPDDGYDYAPFFAALRSAGFNGRMSLEAQANEPDYKTSIENAFKVLEPLL